MVVWAAVLTSLIVLLEKMEFLEIARALVVVIGVWVGGESYLKKVFKKEE